MISIGNQTAFSASSFNEPFDYAALLMLFGAAAWISLVYAARAN